MDQAIKSRVRLWLQSERAMGLNSLPVASQCAADPASRGQEQHQPRSAPKEAPAARPAAVQVDKPRVSPAVALPVERSGEFPLGDSNAPFEASILSREEKIRRLAEMDEREVRGCPKCRLCEGRTHTVFGEGDVDAEIFFVGEGPGEQEDLSGRPFVGRAGQKLDEMIGAMGLRRDQVYIGNIVKCRPPQNRAPLPDEVEACTPYLERQLEIVRPKVIVTLGLPATQYITRTKLSMGRMRGQWHSWRGIKVMATYHPSYILRNYTVETRKAVWHDLQLVMSELGLKPPTRGG